MPRTVSLTALQAMLAQETDEVVIALLTIDHSSLAAPLRYCNNSVAVTSGGQVYQPRAFQPILPTDDPETEPRARIVVSNVDLAIITALRAVTTRPTVTLAVVMSSTPNTAEYGPLTFDVAGATGDPAAITFELTLQDLEQEPFPSQTFDPVRFPALFA